MSKPDKSLIINQLTQLTECQAISFDEGRQLLDRLTYPPLHEYVNYLFLKVKPETITQNLFRTLFSDLLGIESIPELKIDKGFIDFQVRSRTGNPVLVELKPLFTVNKDGAHQQKLLYQPHIEQVLKYLKSNEYVILTNLNAVYCFNRDAIFEPKPFAELTFLQLVELSSGNMWDDLRRLEDRTPKPDLDQAFFEDLKQWYGRLQHVNMEPANGFDKDELIVLLLNKMIFIKTLEDFGLIPFRHLADLYKRNEEYWRVKGYQQVFAHCFKEIEDWFWEYYDTELFRTHFWEYVVKDKENIERFRRVFTALMGFDDWDKVFKKGLIHYNYRHIDEDIYGKAYETFIAENRKDSGIYYTPRQITQYMAERLVKLLFAPLFEQLHQAVDARDFDRTKEIIRQVWMIRIVDPCSGSGSFLIKSLREIYKFYAQLTAKIEDIIRSDKSDSFLDMPAEIVELKRLQEYIGLNDPRLMISRLILTHIYAVDADERALETAKTNLWKEAIKLNERAFNFNYLPEDKNHILPDLELNFICGDSLLDLPLAQQLSIIQAEFKDTIVRLHDIRDAYLKNPFNPNAIDQARSHKKPVIERLKRELPADLGRAVFMSLEFFFCYFDRQGNPLPEAEWGFHGVISNPPWEAIKPVAREYYNRFDPVGKYELEKKDFDVAFKKLLDDDPAFKKGWEDYTQSYREKSDFFYNRYTHQGKGDPNFYKMFLERDLQLLRPNGVLNILIPSGFQTDLGASELRHFIFDRHQLLGLHSFENRGYLNGHNGENGENENGEEKVKLFPDVDTRFKFSIVLIKNEQPAPDKEITFEAKFYMLDPVELETPPIQYSLDMIKKFSPINLSIMEFRSQRDYELCAKIRADHPSLKDTGILLRAEFHMTNDNWLFNKKSAKNRLSLYEGKMIHQYNPYYAAGKYFVDEKKARDVLLGKELYRIKRDLDIPEEQSQALFKANDFKLDYELARLVYRDIGRSTDERTFISTIVPARGFLNNKVPHIVNCHYRVNDNQLSQEILSPAELIMFMSLFNSLVLNYYLRSKISATLNMFYLYELPIPTPTVEQKSYLIREGFALLAGHDRDGLFEELRVSLGLAKEPEFDPIVKRAALEVYIARELYGLSKDDWDYLTSTFIYGSGETRRELDGIIARSKNMFV